MGSRADALMTMAAWPGDVIFETHLARSARFAETPCVADNCRTLIVDDDADMAFLAVATIEMANHGLVIAGVVSSGAEALEKLPEAAPDVIVLDFRMPDRNGLEVAADILEASPGQSIVLFSAYLDENTVAEAQRVGVRECVSKDRMRDLPDIIRKYCPAA
jgi:DNA-binding NarL/FixJ family response regulator